MDGSRKRVDAEDVKEASTGGKRLRASESFQSGVGSKQQHFTSFFILYYSRTVYYSGYICEQRL
uniref:Uncharacterized protein n=1 Tax=Zea mays TaxID=4577 RepID=B6U2T9_MAIZE|nr:hypothetical protein [Zea mays]